ncbi:hypothetical protein ACFQ4O_02105 [Methylopila musalis]|uniref:Uncharacterized protein n=1 Tax=Methylopila musalis TaxID=1134781 RepID=A0ABW3Z3L0_9HYPH
MTARMVAISFSSPDARRLAGVSRAVCAQWMSRSIFRLSKNDDRGRKGRGGEARISLETALVLAAAATLVRSGFSVSSAFALADNVRGEAGIVSQGGDIARVRIDAGAIRQRLKKGWVEIEVAAGRLSEADAWLALGSSASTQA